MPRAFLVLNKKTKTKHKKNTLEEEHDILTDENQNVQENVNHRCERDDEDDNSKITYEPSDNEEDIEIDVEGPCSVHEELLLPQHHSERDSVTSVSPGSSNSLHQHQTADQDASYESGSSNPSSDATFRDGKSSEDMCNPRG